VIKVRHALATALLIAAVVFIPAVSRADSFVPIAKPFASETIVTPDGEVVPVGHPAPSAQPELTSHLGQQGGRMGASRSGPHPFTACSPICYDYAGMIVNYAAGSHKVGTRAETTIEKPAMDGTDWPGGGHTLYELAALNYNAPGGTGRQIIEFGYGIDKANGDGWTHLFGGAWKDGVFLGYGSAGGFVDNGANAVNIDSNVKLDVGTSVTFVDSDEIQPFGELAALHTPSCTDIGHGTLPTAGGTYPTSGSEVTAFSVESTVGGSYSLAALSSGYITNSTKWNAVFKTGSTSDFRFGGPGYTPDPTACP